MLSLALAELWPRYNGARQASAIVRGALWISAKLARIVCSKLQKCKFQRGAR
jgi:hypothetical protein